MPVATFNLAINRPKRENGTQAADFINIVVWGKQAENVNQYLTKGSQVAIDGRIQTRSYDTDNGSKRYITEVVAENVQFLDNKKDGQASESQTVTQTQNTVIQQSSSNPFEEFGKQVALDDYPNMYDDGLPF